jgi:hypothetical protein
MLIDIIKAGYESNIEYNNSNDQHILQSNKDKNLESGNLVPTSVDSQRRKKLLIGRLVDVIVDHFAHGLKLIGPFFAFSLTVFIFFVVHAFFDVLLPYWKGKLGNIFGFLITIILMLLLVNILFNYFLAMLVKPGSIQDIIKSKNYKSRNPYIFTKDIQKEIDFTFLLRNNQISLLQLEKKFESNESNNFINSPNSEKFSKSELDNYSADKLKFCKICNQVKPIRAHHCQVCGVCIFKMDHHCPWINNCVGQNNHRYFMLFLTHTLFGCIFISLLSSPIFFLNSINKNPSDFNFVTVLCLTGSVILLFFNSWNWFLVVKGSTTIEFFSNHTGIQVNSIISDFSMSSIKENLFLVFGSKRILEILLIPSIQSLPFSGLEWNRFIDGNFKIKGIAESEETNVLLTEQEIIRDLDI